jgi:hypothetical protein
MSAHHRYVFLLTESEHTPDFTKGTGSGGESIYGGAFEDEDLSTPLDKAG